MVASRRTTRALQKFRAFSRGLRIAYIGDGKGKTTAAVGLATRARGTGMRVLFVQLYKSPQWPSAERIALQKLGVDVCVYGEGFVGILGDRKKLSVHRAAARRALAESWKAISSGRYDVVILDEAISCLEQRLYPRSALAGLLKRARAHPQGSRVHIVITGHQRYPEILKLCDLVTEMKMVKHPYYKGFLAVKGIDY